MTEYAWFDLRTRLIEACGDSPSAGLEQRVIDVFERRPSVVADAVAHVIKRYEQGVVRSPWAVLAKHVEELSEATERAISVTATDSRDRDKRESQARQWMHTAGIHYDRESEVDDELFGDRGLLHAWRDDAALVSELLGLWRMLRPLGQQVDREEQASAERRIAIRERLTKPTPEVEPIDPEVLYRELLEHAERRVALHATTNPFLDD
jgi:hypothetical protein